MRVRTQRFIHERVPDWKKGSAVGSGLRVESLQMRGKLLWGPSVVKGSARFHLGYGSSGEEFSEEGKAS